VQDLGGDLDGKGRITQQLEQLVDQMRLSEEAILLRGGAQLVPDRAKEVVCQELVAVSGIQVRQCGMAAHCLDRCDAPREVVCDQRLIEAGRERTRRRLLHCD
jgi:hypothetical protein